MRGWGKINFPLDMHFGWINLGVAGQTNRTGTQPE